MSYTPLVPGVIWCTVDLQKIFLKMETMYVLFHNLLPCSYKSVPSLIVLQDTKPRAKSNAEYSLINIDSHLNKLTPHTHTHTHTHALIQVQVKLGKSE